MNFFIASKPLQYLNCLNIPVDGGRSMLLVDSFKDASIFYKNILELGEWDYINLFADETSLYKFLRTRISKNDKLFIDSDYGLKTKFRLQSLKVNNIFVYEEGVGSYRNDLLSSLNYHPLKTWILKILGVKEHMGGTSLVKGLYIYDVDKHISRVSDFKNKRYLFERPFDNQIIKYKTHLIENFADFEKYYKKKYENKDVYLYLTSWNYNEKADILFNDLLTNNSRTQPSFIIKVHPHIKDIKFHFSYDDVIEGNIMAELLIVILHATARSLTVVHEGSSVIHYFPTLNQIDLLVACD